MDEISADELQMPGMPRMGGPRDLPEMRRWVQSQWRPDGMFTAVARLKTFLPGERVEPWTPGHLRLFDPGRIGGAGLYYVTSDVVDVVQASAASLPPTTLTEDLLPEASGFVWLEKPLTGRSADGSTEPISVQAMLWGPAVIRGDAVVGISLYGARRGVFFPLGRTDWAWGADTEEATNELVVGDAARLESMAEDRRVLATILLLMGQKRQFSTEMVEPRKKKQKQNLARRGLSTTVRVIDVGVRQQQRSGGEGGAREVEWTRRWVVRSFWRQQAYGPNWSLRRPQLILPYVKGPQDKPLVATDTVNRLRSSGP